jgi:hypothetical protein
MKPAVRAVALVAMAGALCTSQAVLAEDVAKSPPPKASNAMRVVVDPETGEVRAPTAEELSAQIARENAPAAAARSARAATSPAPGALPAEKQVVSHSNGMLSVKMSEESLSALSATNDASGKTTVKHDSVSAQPVATEQ